MHGLFEREEPGLAAIMPQNAREGAPKAGVRVAVMGQAVGTDHGGRVGKNAAHVLLRHLEVDGAGG